MDLLLTVWNIQARLHEMWL